MLRGLLLGLVILLVACGSQESVEQTPILPGSSPTEVLGTLAVTGRWYTIISETKSQERDGILVTVKQLQFSTPARLLPGVEPSEMERVGADDTLTIAGVRIKVENKTGRDIDFNPTGLGTLAVINGAEEASPEPLLSDSGKKIRNAETVNFRVIFLLSQTEIEDVNTLTYRIRDLDLSYSYSDLIASTP